MESTDLSNWTNGSRFSQNVSNDSFDFSKDIPVVNTKQINITLLTLCLLGLPGNLLVIAVYMRNMTSSLKIYMFSLAIADSAICVCGVIFVQTSNNIFTESAMNAFNVAGVLLHVFPCVCGDRTPHSDPSSAFVQPEPEASVESSTHHRRCYSCIRNFTVRDERATTPAHPKRN